MKAMMTKIDWAKPLQYKCLISAYGEEDGEIEAYPARLLGELQGTDYKVLAVHDGVKEFVLMHSTTQPNGYTVENVPEEIEGWMNIYNNGSYKQGGKIYRTEEEALNGGYGEGRYACIRVKFKKGDGT